MKSIILYLFIFFSVLLQAQNDSLYSVYLIGDTGDNIVPGKALLMLKEQLVKDSNSTVVFLGDNVYPNGLRKNNPNSVKCLESQLQLLSNYKGKAFFIPGNHD